MNKSIKKGFCPRCGALIRGNVCQSCDFTINVNEYEEMQSQVMDEDYFGAIPSPEKNKKTGITIIVVNAKHKISASVVFVPQPKICIFCMLHIRN